jgi:hypothetical protein
LIESAAITKHASGELQQDGRFVRRTKWQAPQDLRCLRAFQRGEPQALRMCDSSISNLAEQAALGDGTLPVADGAAVMNRLVRRLFRSFSRVRTALESRIHNAAAE